MHHGGEGGKGCRKELLVSLEGIMEHKRMDLICCLTTHFALWALLVTFRAWECWESIEGSIPAEVLCLWICICSSCRVLSSKMGQTWKPELLQRFQVGLAPLKSRGAELWRRWCGGHCVSISLSRSVAARKLSVPQDDVSNENRRNLLVTASQDLLVYSRGTFTFVCELRARQ